MTSAKTIPDAREVITRYYKAANSGDWDAWLSLMDDNTVVDEYLTGYAKGVNTLRILPEKVAKGYSKWVVHLKHMVVEGNEVCTGWTLEAITAAGIPINVNGASYFRVENGKIAFWTNFHDTVPVQPDTGFRAFRAAMRGLGD